MIALIAALGLLAGAALPFVIARIPDRVPAGTPDGAADQPLPTPYRELAAGRLLPFVLAVVTGGVWALLAAARRDHPVELVTYLLVAALGVAMAYVDLREHRLPDWLTLPAFAVSALGLAIAAAVAGEWAAYGRAWLGAVAVAGVYLLLAVLRPADLGLGDVKLAASLGLLLGWLGWSTVVVGVFLGFLLGGLAGVILVALGRAGRRTAIPFGPFMLAGALAAVAWGELVADWYLAR